MSRAVKTVFEVGEHAKESVIIPKAFPLMLTRSGGVARGLCQLRAVAAVESWQRSGGRCSVLAKAI